MEWGREARLLILEHDPEATMALEQVLSTVVRPEQIVRASSIPDYRSLISTGKFDVVVLDDEFPGVNAVELLRELKAIDDDPAILIVSGASNPVEVSQIYNAGCERCVVKSPGWVDEVLPAIRQLSRIRRLQEEQDKLVTRLIEANILVGQKNKRLDEFCSTVAHDIRAPLGTIGMKLEYLQEHCAKHGYDDRARQLMHTAGQSIDRLTAIVQNMYDYAKLGEKAAKMRIIPLTTLVEETVHDLQFDEKLDVQIGLGDLPEVWGNPELLRRLFMNLLSNAVKYNDKSATIINIGLRSFREEVLGTFAEICVEDNGPGIPDEERSSIFSMFSRGRAQHGPAEGVGVGLAVVQRIVELHFGTIHVESKVGQGARFVFTLPTEAMAFVR